MAIGTITADSKPVYCVFGGSDCWTCLDLMAWHNEMRKKYGKDEANKRFLNSWENDAPFICKQYDCRSFDASFRDYFKKVNLLDQMYGGLGVIAKPIGFATDVSGNVADTITITSKTLKWLVPAIIVTVVIVGIIWLYKNASVFFPKLAMIK